MKDVYDNGPRPPHKKMSKKIEKQRISPLLPPCALPRPNLLQWGLGSGTSGKRSGAVAHHSIRDRAEGAYACSVSSDRRRDRLIGGGRSAGYARQREGIAALGARCQLRIDQASARRV